MASASSLAPVARRAAVTSAGSMRKLRVTSGRERRGMTACVTRNGTFATRGPDVTGSLQSRSRAVTDYGELISLRYRESRRKDRHGNEFRYRAWVYRTHGSDVGWRTYDVFLTSTE